MIFLNDIGSIALSTDKESYSKKPDSWDIKAIFYASILFGIMVIFEVSILAYFGLFYFHLNHASFETFLFVAFMFSIEALLLSIRSRKRFFHSRPSIPVLLQIILAITITAIIAYFGVLMSSINPYYILFIGVVAVLFLVITDYIKVFAYKKDKEFSLL
jgi:H+-transporting ATPase